MKTNCTWLSILILVAVSMTGCGKKGLSELPVFPVKGTVKVDGKPEMGVTVKLHPVNGVDTAHPTYPEGITLPDGTFSITTYATNDGAPIGEYKVTFFFGEINPISMQMGGEDKLNNRYQDPKKSTLTVSVVDKPVDLGLIELKSSE